MAGSVRAVGFRLLEGNTGETGWSYKDSRSSSRRQWLASAPNASTRDYLGVSDLSAQRTSSCQRLSMRPERADGSSKVRHAAVNILEGETGNPPHADDNTLVSTMNSIDFHTIRPIRGSA